MIFAFLKEGLPDFYLLNVFADFLRGLILGDLTIPIYPI
jgi:hypothetical protein